MQLIASTILLIGVIYLAAILTFPGKFDLILKGKTLSSRTPLYPFFCSLFGLISGLIIAAFT